MANYQIDHLHLFSTDPVKTANYYQNHLGAILVRSSKAADGKITVNINLGGITLLISTAAEGKPVGLAHFAIRTDCLDKSVEELKSKGVKFTTDIVELPSVKYLFMQAPENVNVEILERMV